MFAKMKKMTACALAACALCLALAPGIAWAGEAPGVVLDEGASNGSVDVSLVVPKGGDEVRALKLSLTVKGEGGEALEAGFGFSKAVEGAAVAQVRFKPVDGGQRVNLYVAVKDGNLFSGDRLDLGTLALSSSSDSVAEVSVSSLEVVSSSHVEMDEKQLGMELPAPLSVKVASGSSVGPDEPGDPGGTPGGSPDDGSGDGSGGNPGDGSEGSGQNPGENSGEGTGGSNAKPSPEKLPSGPNVSPGAPSGSDKALVTTGDGLFPLVAGCVAVALVAGAVVLVVALRSRRR